MPVARACAPAGNSAFSRGEIAERRLSFVPREARLGSARSEVHLHSFQAASGEIDARYSIYDEPAGRQRDSETWDAFRGEREGQGGQAGCAIFSHSSSSARPGGQWPRGQKPKRGEKSKPRPDSHLRKSGLARDFLATHPILWENDTGLEGPGPK